MDSTPRLGRDTARAAPTRAPVTAPDLRGVKSFRVLGPLVTHLQAVGTERERAGHRQLCDDQDATLLLDFFSPLVTSLRGLQQATTLAPGQDRFGVRPTALGALSEAAQVCAAAVRQGVMAAWGRRLGPPAVATARAALHALSAVEGRRWPALPKRAWAVWPDAQHRAAKRPVACEVLRQLPVGGTVTAGPASARAEWRRLVPPGGFDVVDRGAADDARVQEWHERPCHGLARVPSTAADAVHDERPVSAAAPAAGGPRDGLSRRRATPHHPASAATLPGGAGGLGHDPCGGDPRPAGVGDP